MKPDFLEITAAAIALPAAAATAPQHILYMPVGRHDITPSVDGKPRRVTIHCNEASAAALQHDLAVRIAAGRPPFLTFDHDGGRAAAWVQAFTWDPDKGVIARVRWTPDGWRAVTVQAEDQEPAYRSFSPTFRAHPDSGVVLGLLPGGEAGAFVNDPAFPIRRIAAANNLSAQPAEPNPNKKDQNMKHEAIAAAVIAAGLLTESEAAGDNAGQLLTERAAAVKAKAAAAPDESAIAAVTARLTALETENKALKTDRAAAAVSAAVKAGRIPAKDKDTLEFWLAAILAQGESAVAALNAMPSAVPSPSGAVHPGASAAEAATPAVDGVKVAAKAQELRAANPSLTWDAAWDAATALCSPAKE